VNKFELVVSKNTFLHILKYNIQHKLYSLYIPEYVCTHFKHYVNSIRGI